MGNDNWLRDNNALLLFAASLLFCLYWIYRCLTQDPLVDHLYVFSDPRFYGQESEPGAAVAIQRGSAGWWMYLVVYGTGAVASILLPAWMVVKGVGGRAILLTCALFGLLAAFFVFSASIVVRLAIAGA